MSPASENPVPVHADIDSNAASKNGMPVNRNGNDPQIPTITQTRAVAAIDVLVRGDLDVLGRKRNRRPIPHKETVAAAIHGRASHSSKRQPTKIAAIDVRPIKISPGPKSRPSAGSSFISSIYCSFFL